MTYILFSYNALLAATGSVAQFVTVFLIFIFVLVLTYFTTRFVGGVQKNKMSGSNISVVEAMNIGNNKAIEIVRICDKYYAIAVTKDNVTFIGEVDESAIQNHSGGSFDSFESVLKKFRRKELGRPDDNDVEEEDL